MQIPRARLLIGLAAIALLTFLFLKTRAVDLSEHDRYRAALRQTQELDAQLNLDVLKVGYSLLDFYDPIVTGMQELRKMQEALRNPPAFVKSQERQTIGQEVDRFGELLSEKAQLVDRFQSANIRLRNSLNYLPILAADIQKMANGGAGSRASTDLLGALLRDTLIFSLDADPLLAPVVEAHIDELETNLDRHVRVLGDYELALVIAHVRSILAAKPQLDQITRELEALPTSEQVERLQSLYGASYDGAETSADFYRMGLFISSIGMMLYLGWIFVQLRQTSEALNIAKGELEQRVEERTQRLESSQARNRALVDAIPDLIFRLSKDGVFLDVKESSSVPLARPADEIVGLTISDVFPKLASRAIEAVESAIETSRPQVLNYQLRNTDGDLCDYEARVVVSGADQVLTMVRDVTQQRQAASQLEKARQQSDELLHNILPEEIATELRAHGSVQPKYFENVTVVQTQFLGFSKSTNELAAEELVEVLNKYFTAFDEIVARYRLEKLKTVGDKYICVGGLPVRKPSHPVDAVLAALEMVEAARRLNKKQLLAKWDLRVGVHTGPVVAGVVGIQKFAFDVWGQSVRLSTDLLRTCAPNRTNLSADTYARVKDFFECESRGKIKIPDGEPVDMFFVTRPLPSLSEGTGIRPPAAFSDRYRIYFEDEPPAFPPFMILPDSGKRTA